MNPLILVAPPTAATRRPTGDPPGDPPGDFAPVLAHAAQAPGPKSRNDGARTAPAEGAKGKAAAQTEVQARDAATTEGESGTATVAGAESAPTSDEALAQAAQPETASTTTNPAPGEPISGDVPQQDVQANELEAGAAVVIKAPPGEAATDPAAFATGPRPTTTDPAAAAPSGATTTTTLPAATAATDTALPQPATTGSPAAGTAVPADGQPVSLAATPGDGGGAGGKEQSASGSPRHHEAPPAASAGQSQAATGEPQAAASATPAAETPRPAQPQPAGDAGAATPVVKPDLAAGELLQPQAVPSTPGQALGLDRTAADTPVRAHSQLAQLADTARTVVRMAARDGAAQAHITLHPVELGEIEIRLRYHAGGVSADVRADSPAAAQLLQQASGELKRSLEAQGLIVHNLDVRHGEQERRAHEHGGHGSRSHGRAHTNDHMDHTTIDTSRLPLAAGAVDVLA